MDTFLNTTANASTRLKSQNSKNDSQWNSASPQDVNEHDKWWRATLRTHVAEHDEKYHEKQTNNGSIQDFRIAKTLGSGSFGRVVLVKHTPTGDYYAMKILIKDKIIKMRQVDHTLAEKRILYSINFPFWVRLCFNFKDNSNLYLVLTFEQGGEMFTHLRKAKKFPEVQARFYCAQVIMAFEYLHELEIVYRDLKPENMLLSLDGYCRVTDLGFAKKLQREHPRTYTLCGTPEYLAPEVIRNRGYGKSVDWWTVGVLIFEMTAGNVPFYSKDQQHMYRKIVQGNLYLPSHFSPELKDLCSNILQVDTSKRYGCLRHGVKDIKQHPWFTPIKWQMLYEKQIRPPWVPDVRGIGDASYFHTQREEKIHVSVNEKYADAFAKF